MKKILVAGATGYLGRNVVKALKNRGYWVRALGRSADKLEPIKEFADELFIGEVTDPASLDGLCDGIDVVFSSVGITRQKDGLTYRDVDYQGNRNLLAVAEGSGVSKFVYVHLLNAEKLEHIALVQAKQAFVDELKRSSLDHKVICPTGFFSDMEEFLSMARSGRVYLFGDGSNRINPYMVPIWPMSVRVQWRTRKAKSVSVVRKCLPTGKLQNWPSMSWSSLRRSRAFRSPSSLHWSAHCAG